MSYRPDKILARTGIDFSKKSSEEIQELFLPILEDGMHGICFSLYEDGQKPGDIIGEDQIRRRMQILKPYSKWVRSFSCIEGNEHIPRIAREMGMKTLGYPRSPSYFGISYSKMQGLRNVFQVSSATVLWS